MNILEEGKALTLDFKKLRKVAETDQDVIPVVLQHAENGKVLFIGLCERPGTQGNIRNPTGRAVVHLTQRVMAQGRNLR